MDLASITYFCDVCKVMLAKIITHCNKELPESEPHYEFSGPHHQSTEHLLISAALGCGICVTLKEEMESSSIAHRYSPVAGDDPWLRFTCIFWPDVNGIRLAFECYKTSNYLASFMGDMLGQVVNSTNLNFSFSVNTGDVQNFEQIRSWLSNCLSSHQLCDGKKASKSYPPRLLCLSDDLVRLVDSTEHKVHGDYIALSYCWGRNPRHLTLTGDNIGAFRQGLKISHLAKTFREAIQVTKSLELEYLWIDALCILQSGDGHLEDWQKHCSEMAKIYANCVLNIAVDQGEDAEAGCFVSRDPRKIKPCVFDPSSFPEQSDELSLESSTPSLTGPYLLVATGFHRSLINETHLLSRGWVHQERLLSPRTLHYGKKQLLWECTTLTACETFSSGLPPNRNPSEQAPFNCDGADPDQWFRIVEAYSAANLTNLGDKLPAVAGIAKAISSHRDEGNYGAGFFLGDLPQCLLWIYNGGFLGSPVIPLRAPTWTWASREGRIMFLLQHTYEESGFLASIQNIFIDFVESQNPFGQVNGGVLTLKAPLLRIALEEQTDEVQLFTRKIELSAVNTGEKPSGFPSLTWCFWFDESAVIRPRTNMAVLFIAYTHDYLLGLILTPSQTTASSQCWIRIGLFCVDEIVPDKPGWVRDSLLVREASHYLKEQCMQNVDLV